MGTYSIGDYILSVGYLSLFSWLNRMRLHIDFLKLNHKSAR